MQVDHLEALYHEGIRIRDEWFAAYVANLNRLSRELGSARQFAIDMGHLIPRPPEGDRVPNDPHKKGMPPPLPGQGATDDELDQEWFNRVIAQREHWQKNTA